MKIKILVVDDEQDALEVLSFKLREAGFTPVLAKDGTRALAIAREEHPDLIVLDLMLPEVDGLEVCKILRRDPTTASIPIVMLTGVRDEADRVMGLELGADDYLTKPFSPRELLARIRTVLRRTKGAALAQARERQIRAYRFAELELNLRTRRLKRLDGRPIDLTNGEFNLLAALLGAPQRVLTRDQLLETSRVYDNEVYDRSIDVQVTRLRRKIEADPSHPRFIVTERGVGYAFNCAVEVLY